MGSVKRWSPQAAKAAIRAVGKKPRRKADDGLTDKTLTYLATQHDVWAERRNSGHVVQLAPGGGRYKIWLGEPGTPDVCGLLMSKKRFVEGVANPQHMGLISCQLIYFGIETKCKGGKLNPAQRKFHEKAAKWGMPVCTVETLDDVKLFLEGLRR